MRAMRAALTLFVAVLGGWAAAAPSTAVVQACPALRVLPETYSNRWVIGTSTERMFLSSQFQQVYDLSAVLPDLQRLNDALQEHGTFLVMLPIPRVGAYYEDLLDTSDPLLSGFDFPRSRLSFRQMVLSLTEAGIAAIDVSDDVLRHKGQIEEFTQPTDIHWTPAGAEATAKRLANDMKKRFGSIIKAIPEQQIDLTRKPLYRFAGFGGYANTLCGASLPLNTFSAYMAERPDEKLLDDHEPEIVVLGDSYISGTYDVGFSALLANELQRDVLAYGVPSGGVVKAPEQYFAEIRKLPKILVWQFVFDLPRLNTLQLAWRAVQALP